MRDANMAVLLAVTAALLLIVVGAQLFGRLAVRVGQPAVVGEMVSGIVLGPTVLGAFAPSLSQAVFSATARPTLYVISMVGLSLYMFLVGLEHEYRPGSRSEAVLPIVLSVGVLVLPLVLGGASALYLSPDYRPADIELPVFVLFVGGALSLTAFPMLARMLQERNMMHTRFGGVAVRTAGIDDATAWCVLAVVSALTLHGNWLHAGWTIVPAVLFVVAAFVLLPKIFRAPMERAVRSGELGNGLLAALLGLVLAAGWFTDYIGVYSVFGGVVCGLALPRVPGFAALVHVRLMQVVTLLFLPVFFAFSGLNTDLSFAGTNLWAFLIVVVAAFGSKFLGSVFIMRWFRWSWGESVAMGGLLNARGLMILIFINVGLMIGVIDQRLFSLLVLIAVTTTALAMPIYRSHFTPAREREARAALLARSEVVRQADTPAHRADRPESPDPAAPASW